MSETPAKYQGLFSLLSTEHGLTLTISEMDEVIREALKVADINQIKAEAWDEGVDVCSNYLGEYDYYMGLTEEFKSAQKIEAPIMPENPYKEQPEPPTWEARDAWDAGFADNH